MSELRRYIEDLVEAYGVSGFEDDVRAVMKRELEPLVDEVTVDGMGNVIGRKDGAPGGPKLMLCAHMDEVGLLVSYVDDKGFIRFNTGVGWIDPRILLALDVIIHTRKGPVPGMIGTKAVHLCSKEEMESGVDIRNMFIDIGATSREEAESWGVRIGCPISFDAKVKTLKNPDLIVTRALDNRAGCAVILEVLRRLKGTKLEATIYGVGSTQEEVGMRGAPAAAFAIEPDAAVILDMPFPGGDTPGIEERDLPLKMGAGVLLEVCDHSGRTPAYGLIANPHLRNFIEDLAIEAGIKVQFGSFAGTGTTDGATIQMSRSGVPSAVMAVSGRYDHGPLVMASMTEMEQVTDLTVRVAKSFQNFKRPE
ncbi:MAG: M42 family metallopeptidase [Chloroflexi bacterium]|nr:M42 family metallopeptidase [Chloroflexota bacterium]